MIKPFSDGVVVVKTVLFAAASIWIWLLVEISFLRWCMTALCLLNVIKIVAQSFHSKNALFDQIGVAAFIAETIVTAVMLTLLFEHYSFAVQESILLIVVAFAILLFLIDSAFLWKYVGVLVKNLYAKR